MKRFPWIVAALLGACGGADAPRDAGAAEARGAAPGRSALSNAGAFHVTLHAEPPEPPLNEEFEVRLTLRSAPDGEQLDFELADVAVDARMPAHGHGMNVEPALSIEDGVLVARGLLLHMIGHWELYVDLTRGPLTERAQFDFELR